MSKFGYCICNIWARSDCKVHESTNCVHVRNVAHLFDLFLGSRGLALVEDSSRIHGHGDWFAVSKAEVSEHVNDVLGL